MLDKKGQLWIVDWDLSGWFPIYLEYTDMQNFHRPTTWGWFDYLRWRLFSWISVGWYEEEKKAVYQGVCRSVARRNGRHGEVLVEGVSSWDLSLEARRPDL